MAGCASGKPTAANHAPIPTPKVSPTPLPAPLPAPLPPPGPTPEELEVTALLAQPGSASTSVGGTSMGSLVGGVPFPARGPGFLRNPKSPNPDGGFGTVELVQALVRAATVVHQVMPGADLVVNDLGLAQGGPIYHHASHQAGRDADVLFYYLHRDRDEVFPAKGIPVEPDGTGWDYGEASDPADDVPVRLDVARTWRFMDALLSDERVSVQRVFVVEHVRSMLLDYAGKHGANPTAVARFEEITCQPSVAHDDHFHIRLFCTPEDIRAGCADGSPLYPAHLAALAAEGLKPLTAKTSTRAAVAKRTVSEEQAEASMRAAGPMDKAIREFLERRKAWIKQPHPGRPFCK